MWPPVADGDASTGASEGGIDAVVASTVGEAAATEGSGGSDAVVVQENVKQAIAVLQAIEELLDAT